ncbi:MAG: hypothetical protein ABI885_13975 [Gammaproteobacteria bacterium]
MMSLGVYPASITSQAYSKQFGELDLTALVDELAAQNALASKGDMARAEGMLMSQAHTLEAIFHEMARRAALNMGEYIGAAETYLRLGLKAQSQCRATLETLAAIKNPAPVTFVKQANVAHGPQQVNNPPTEVSRARESENQPGKLLEQQRNEWMDGEAAQATVGADRFIAGNRGRSPPGRERQSLGHEWPEMPTEAGRVQSCARLRAS